MYTDFNVRYPQNLKESLLKDADDIIQSLERLFCTRKGSVPFNRSYGTDVWSLLFENDLDLYQVETLIYQDIQIWEPRVQLVSDDVNIVKTNEHTYSLDVTFKIPSLGDIEMGVTSNITDQ